MQAIRRNFDCDYSFGSQPGSYRVTHKPIRDRLCQSVNVDALAANFHKYVSQRNLQCFLSFFAHGLHSSPS